MKILRYVWEIKGSVLTKLYDKIKAVGRASPGNLEANYY